MRLPVGGVAGKSGRVWRRRDSGVPTRIFPSSHPSPAGLAPFCGARPLLLFCTCRPPCSLACPAASCVCSPASCRLADSLSCAKGPSIARRSASRQRSMKTPAQTSRRWEDRRPTKVSPKAPFVDVDWLPAAADVRSDAWRAGRSQVVREPQCSVRCKGPAGKVPRPSQRHRSIHTSLGFVL